MRKMLHLVVVAALALIGLGVGPLVAEPRRVALIIAIEGYEALRPLKTPVQDALAMDDLLGDLGFEVTLEIDRDMRQLRGAVEDFTEDAAGADLALVYYAGHGVEIAGENLILPVDVSAEGTEALKAGALPLNELAAALRAVVPSVVVILDACREDPFGSVPAAEAEAGRAARGARPLDAKLPDGVAGGFARVGRAEGMIFAFSTAPGKVASDGQGQHSPFAEALIRHLPVPGRSLPDALTLIQQDVYDRSGGWQLPYVETALPELVFLAGEPPPPDERDRLLLAMAGLTEQDRALVETVASRNGIPLAPLYASWLAMDPDETPEWKEADLARAAADYVAFRREREGLSPAHPEVEALLAEAFADMELGLLQSARDKLDKAKDLSRTTVERSRDRLVADIVAAAETYLLSSHLAEVQGDFGAAYDDLLVADALFSDNGGRSLPLDAQATWAKVLIRMGVMYESVSLLVEAEAIYWEALEIQIDRALAEPTDLQVWADMLEASLSLTILSTNYSEEFEPSVPVAPLEEIAVQLDGLAERSGDGGVDPARLAHLFNLFAIAHVEEHDPARTVALQEAIKWQERALALSPNDSGLALELTWWWMDIAFNEIDPSQSDAALARALELAEAQAAPPAIPGGEANLARVLASAAILSDDPEAKFRRSLAIMRKLVDEDRAPYGMLEDIRRVEAELDISTEAPQQP